MASRNTSTRSRAARVKLAGQGQKRIRKQPTVIGLRVRPVCESCGCLMRSRKVTKRATHYYCLTAGCDGKAKKLLRAEPPAIDPPRATSA